MNETATYQKWIDHPGLDPALKAELEAIAGNQQEIDDRFYRDLAFGTGGLRGIIGAGTNRMNTYTVRKATRGLADYLNATVEAPTVAIAYDTRNKSLEFAEAAAQVLAAAGIKAYLFDSVRPTPMLSFAVRHLGADAGIVITASHNPKEYNGYKVYGPDGGQITDEAAAAILERIDACDLFAVDTMPSEEAHRAGLLQLVNEEVDGPYYERVKALTLRRELVEKRAGELKIIYSPLHGSGNLPVRRVLRELGYTGVAVVVQQEQPDGNFPTTPYPNPEEPAVYALAIEMARRSDPDLIFATDPDCDRIGVLVKNEAGAFSVLSGNQVGVLLCDYILTTRREQGTLPANAAVVKTIVTTDMARAVCDQGGAALVETLTGFKYIGEKIGEWERSGDHTFLLGFEESFGYLAGAFVRDKDAVMAAALIAEMALYYKDRGLTLFQAMAALYEKYGHYAEKLISVTMPGAQGQQRIADCIGGLRENYRELLAGESLHSFEDYGQSQRVDCLSGSTTPILLPKSNVLKFIFGDGSWMVLRPSGTEPKMKIYLAAKGGDASTVAQRLSALEGLIGGLIGE